MGFIEKYEAKLSKIQKAILECPWQTEDHWCYIRKISWFVAHRFNRGHRDRIWVARQAKLDHSKDNAELTRYCQLMDACHRQQQLLTEKHRAAFSRSLKRLEERGSIKRCVDCSLETNILKEHLGGGSVRMATRKQWVFDSGTGRTIYVVLTERGQQVAEGLFGAIDVKERAQRRIDEITASLMG